VRAEWSLRRVVRERRNDHARCAHIDLRLRRVIAHAGAEGIGDHAAGHHRPAAHRKGRLREHDVPAVEKRAAFTDIATLTEAIVATAAVPVTRRMLGRSCFTVDLVDIVRVLLGNDLFDFESERPKQPVFRICPHELTFAVNRAFALASGDTDVGHL